MDDSNSGLKDYIDMMKQIKAPPELVEKAVTNACELKQMKLEEHCPELEGIDDFCIDDYRGVAYPSPYATGSAMSWSSGQHKRDRLPSHEHVGHLETPPRSSC